MMWRNRASCKGRGDVDWDGFGPVQVLICSGCPVRTDCLHAGLQEPESAGTWGMTSEAQRHRLRAGKDKVVDVWERNEAAATSWLEERRKGPTEVWNIR